MLNSEHYVAFCLPYRKCVANINDFAEIKYEFVLSEQFCQRHFPVGVLLTQLSASLQEGKGQRRIAIQLLRNMLCKHSFDSRYNDDRVIIISMPLCSLSP